MQKRQCVDFVDNLIDQSLDNWRTRWYDKYQRCTLGIAY
jgi:phosphatidylinositol 4-kinase